MYVKQEQGERSKLTNIKKHNCGEMQFSQIATGKKK